MKQIDIKSILPVEHEVFLYSPGKIRRQLITEQMDAQSAEGKNCFSCEGFCCTFAHNSMQVTPIETIELINFLIEKNRLNEDLLEELRQTVADYRLDKDVNLKKDTRFRRTYTCPFFKSGPKGCTIAPESKPYGCLAFNPIEKNVTTEGHCSSDLSLLEKREALFAQEEDSLNEKLREELGLYWAKLPIPLAILELIKAVGI
jgi:Fe-S-cluster containining protein